MKKKHQKHCRAKHGYKCSCFPDVNNLFKELFNRVSLPQAEKTRI